jgi:ribonucleoside-diphosphate reductase alpha chain
MVVRFPFSEISLTGLQEKIFLDRYAAKELDHSKWKLGNKIIATTHEDPNQPLLRKTVTGILREVKDNTYTIEDVNTGELVDVPRTAIEYPEEQQPKEMWDRIAHALAGVEKPEKQQEVYEQFAYALNDFKLVGGGRVMAGAGTEELTLINCFVIPDPHDSRRGIFESVADMADIMARGGGVGVNLSSLRPKRAIVAGVNGHSSGSVSWGGVFSHVTGLIEQGGSRRGALMLMIWDWHPDLLSFIRAKTQMGAITNANMSICISDAFMKAVKENGDWVTKFPVTSHPAYDTEWDGNIQKWEEKGYPVEIYHTYKAREIWNEIITSAWKSAEPGIVFMEYANYMSNSWYFNPLISTNPCGEQFLPKFGVCNLSAINLSKFYDEGKHDVDWDELAKITRIGVRFCDNVTTFTMYPLDQIVKNQVEDERRSGLGTMGLAELLIKLQIRYGSDESIEFLDRLYGFIAREAYIASAELAKEKGSFGKFNADYFLESGFMKHMLSEIPGLEAIIRENGMRNVTVITQAPTGSSGTMAGTSTGIEPYFAFEYFRQGRLGTEKQYVPIAQEWKESHPGEDLPEWFVTAQDLSPEDHVRVQAAIQKWTDSAISKTANAPSEFTVEDTARLYELAYDLGCKGVTIYRDGSRDIQVLSTVKETEKEAPKGLEKAEVTHDEQDFQSSKVCEIRFENGQLISECGTE